MPKSNIHLALSRLHTILNRSLLAYLLNTSPWLRRGEEQALATVRRMAEQVLELANRVSEYTIDRYGPPERGEFPIDFFDTHDLSLDFLLKKLVVCQQRDIVSLEVVVPQLAFDRTAAALAEEALGAARGHLETLEALVAGETPQPTPAAAH